MDMFLSKLALWSSPFPKWIIHCSETAPHAMFYVSEGRNNLPDVLCLLCAAIILPVIEYGSEIWGTKQYIYAVGKIFLKE